MGLGESSGENTMRLKFGILLVGLMLVATAPAWASGAAICGGASGDVGPSLAIDNGNMLATAWVKSGSVYTSTDLYCKGDAGDENGLGMVTGNSDHEIEYRDFIQLNLSKLLGMGVHSATFSFGSVQSGEGFKIFTSGSSFSGGGAAPSMSLIYTGGSNLDMVPININWGSNSFLDITATYNCYGSDVLLTGASSTSPTPEPGTWLLFGTGILALGFLLRKKLAFGSC